MCDVAEEDLAELMAWREAIAGARATVPSNAGATATAELRRWARNSESATAPA